jgi:hypothetical protein
MALVTTPIKSPLGNAICQDTALGSVSDNDIRAGATTVYYLDLDNSLNAATTYFKAWNAAAPTVGTTAPDMVIPVPASTRLPIPIPGGLLFSANLSMAAVTTGGTAGTTAPSSNFTARVLCT